MKTAETKTSSTANSQIQAKRQPFFSKEGEGSFFSKSNEATESFFSPTTVQPKLTIGQPNDKYEVEADAMADKVVQRLSSGSEPIQQIGYHGNAALQTKCDNCEEEEKGQKKEEEKVQKQEEEVSENELEVQTKPIFESNGENQEADLQTKLAEEPTVQAKSIDIKTSPPLTETSSAASTVSLIPTATIQPKCEECEKEETEKVEEQPELQRKSLSGGGIDPTDDEDPDIQRRALEMEKTEYPILFKRRPNVQLSSGVGNESSMRDRIVEEAQKMVGKIEAKKDDGSGRRVGADHLLEIFHLAAKDAWPDEVIENVRYTKEFPHWCGIFSVYAIKKAGIDLGFWEVGVGVSRFGTLQPTDSPQPGDIGYFTKFQHHCIIKAVNGDSIDSIDGNSGNFSEVIERNRPRSQFHAFFTPFTGSEKSIQKKEEAASDNSGGSSLKGSLSATTGKGSSLDTETQSQMETGFGADFSGVNIHTDSRAVQMNKDLNAQAFTHGNDIYFNEGKYSPETTSGKHLLAHELTHTIQQGKTSIQPKRKAGDLKKETSKSTPNIQKRAWYEVDIPFTDYHFDPSIRGLKNAANLTKNTVKAGGKFVYEKGKEFLIRQINRIAPGLLKFLRGDWKEIIKTKIGGAIDKLFGGLISKVQTVGLMGILGGFVGQVVGDIFSASSNLASKTQAAVSKAAKAIFKFVSSLTKPLLRAFQKVSGQFISLLSGIWKKLGLPVFKAVESIAGGTWNWLKSKASWVWKQISRVKNLLSEAWDWIKEKFNIAWSNSGSVWSWIKDKISAAWDAVYKFIQPLINPLKSLSSVFKLFTSGGPLGALWSTVTSFWGYAVMLIQFINVPRMLIRAGAFVKNVILPFLMRGIKQLKGLLNAGFTWLVSVFNSVSAAFVSLVSVLNGVILSVIKAIVKAVEMVFNMVKSMFVSLIGYLVDAVNSIMSDFWGFLKTLLTFTVGIVIILSNPANWFIYFAALATKLVWTLIPDFIKPPAIEFLIDMTIKGLKFISPPSKLGSIWEVVVTGIIGFLKRIKKMGPNMQIRFIEKLINTAINPSYYTGLLAGVVKGIVWDGLVGLIRAVIDIFVMLPDLIMGIYNFFKELLNDIASIKKILKSLKKLSKDVEKFINDPKALDQMVKFIKKSPKILFAMVEKAFEKAKNWAKDTGAKLADSLFKFVLSSDAFTIGLEVGTIIGMILFELLLLFFSGSIGNAVKWGGKAISWIGKGLKKLMDGLRKGAGMIKKGFLAIKAIASAGWKALKSAVKGTLAKVFNRLKKLMDDIIEWFTKTFKKAFGKKKGPKPKKPKPKKPPKGAKEARWQAFKFAVKQHFSKSKFQKDGLSKPRALKELRKVMRNYKKVARLPFIPVGTDDGYYTLRAVKKGKNPFGRRVGKVPMPTKFRWRKGNKAVKKRLKKLKSSEYSTAGINTAIKPFIGKYKYSVLEAKWDSREKDWDIIAGMSPKDKIAEVEKDAKDLHTGTYSDPIPIHWYKRPQDYPDWITLTIDNTEERVPMYSNRQVFWKKYKTRPGKMYRIGVSTRNSVHKGRILKMGGRHKRKGSAQSDFRNLLKAKGYKRFNKYKTPSFKDVDHVTDIGFGGSNRNSNLWPLKASINQRPFRAWRESYIIKYKKIKNGNIRAKEAPIGELWGKHFKVIGFKYPPPVPGGKDKS